MDHALQPVAAETEADDEFVRAFADHLAKTHGAPIRRAAEVEA
ncbi:MAG TPA: hypothetical protein VHS58_06995 [Acetobacteraceae bacterium]|jgi:hypothetical protein|nr:hypothetical protein [Acetobacteraceae bacterium]